MLNGSYLLCLKQKGNLKWWAQKGKRKLKLIQKICLNKILLLIYKPWYYLRRYCLIFNSTWFTIKSYLWCRYLKRVSVSEIAKAYNFTRNWSHIKNFKLCLPQKFDVLRWLLRSSHQYLSGYSSGHFKLAQCYLDLH